MVIFSVNAHAPACAGHSNYDDVDIQHVKHNLEYVCLFVKQKMGNKEEAYSMMVSYCVCMFHVSFSE